MVDILHTHPVIVVFRRGHGKIRGILVLMVLLSLAPRFGTAETLSFVLAAPANRALEARIIADQLAVAGIRVDVDIREKSELNAMAANGLGRAYLTDWGSSFFDPYDLAVPKLSTNGKGNFSFYSNPRVDELLALAGTSADPLLRKKAYLEVQGIIHAQSPWAFGYTMPRFEAASFCIQGYTPSLDGRVNLHDVRLTEGDALFVVLNTNTFLTMDPAAYRDRETETVIRNLFDALVTRTPGGKVVMELAESYRMPDPTTYVFTLRRDVRFHNSDPMRAADVVFTFERILNPYGLNGQASPRRELLGPLVRVEPAGTHQVRFVLDRPFPLFLQALVHFQIVPEKYLRKIGETGFARRPVGTGPYRFAGGTVDTEIVMEPFRGYYGGAPELAPVGAARIGRVIFRPVSDAHKRTAVFNDPAAAIVQDISADGLDALRRRNLVKILTVSGTRSFQMELNNALPPFDDIRLRKAVCYATDWKAILKQTCHGYGTVLATCFLPSGFGFDPGLRPLVPDLAATRQLLEQAGYEPLANPKNESAGGATAGSPQFPSIGPFKGKPLPGRHRLGE